MYDTIIFDLEYSNDGNEFDIISKVYLEDNSVLIDRKYKLSKDAVATQRIRYSDISDVSIDDSCVTISYSKGSVYLKGNESTVKEFYDNLAGLI